MAKIPIKFKRVAAAFDEAARRRGPCDSSSGSEYWPESGTDLSDLVNSFIEKRDEEDHFDVEVSHESNVDDINDNKDDANWVSDNDEDDDTETKERLQELFLECGVDSGDSNGVKRQIYDEVEVALRLIDEECGKCFASRDGLKRSLMAHLRDQGFDAGLCKSRWEKTGRFPSGTYEYIDVKVGPTRYIIEVYWAGQFEIARPKARYTALLEMIPSILIIDKPQVLKHIMKLMSNAMKDSLKHVSMHVPPWRRNGYLQAKYFSPYKRTTNRESTGVDRRGEKVGSTKRRSTVGFEASVMPRVTSFYCRGDEFATKSGVRVGLLAAALQGK